MPDIRTDTPPWSALRVLAPALDRASVEWRLGGSALLAAVGIDVTIRDLDVTVPAAALDEVLAACERWVVDTNVGDAPSPWCSDWLTTLAVDGTEVDVIGGFCVVGPAGRVAVPQDLGGHLALDGIDVPLADPAVWWWVYRAYRPSKAAMLAEVVTPDRRAEVEGRLGPSPSIGTTPG